MTTHPAELVGGPFDGQLVQVEHNQRELRIPIPPRADALALHAPALPNLFDPAVACYSRAEELLLDGTALERFRRTGTVRGVVSAKFQYSGQAPG